MGARFLPCGPADELNSFPILACQDQGSRGSRAEAGSRRASVDEKFVAWSPVPALLCLHR